MYGITEEIKLTQETFDKLQKDLVFLKGQVQYFTDVVEGMIGSKNLHDDAVTTAKVLDGAITATKITLTLDDISDGSTYGRVAGTSISGGLIIIAGLDSGITAQMFTTEANRDNIEAWKHASDVTLIDGGKIYTNSIVVSGLASAVTGRMFDSSARSDDIQAWVHASDVTYIDGGKIYTNSITATQIAANTITATQIAANTITAAEIAANTITATEIVALTITAAEIAASTITGAQIAATTIEAGNIAANTITAGQIAGNTITATEIAAGTITTTEIAATTIVAGNIAAGTITGTEIAATTIVAGNIATNAITADKILADAVTADKISVTSLAAIHATLGTVSAGVITASTIGTSRINITGTSYDIHFSTSGISMYDAASNYIRFYKSGVGDLYIYLTTNGMYLKTSDDFLKIQVGSSNRTWDFKTSGAFEMPNLSSNPTGTSGSICMVSGQLKYWNGSSWVNA